MHYLPRFAVDKYNLITDFLGLTWKCMLHITLIHSPLKDMCRTKEWTINLCGVSCPIKHQLVWLASKPLQFDVILGHSIVGACPFCHFFFDGRLLFSLPLLLRSPYVVHFKYPHFCQTTLNVDKCFLANTLSKTIPSHLHNHAVKNTDFCLPSADFSEGFI